MRTDEQRDGVVVFLFLLEGGDDAQSWNMEAALRAKYGAEVASAEVARFASMLDREQQMWRLTPVG